MEDRWRDRSEQEQIRLEKLRKLQSKGWNYPNKVSVTHDSQFIQSGNWSHEPNTSVTCTIAGRVMSLRRMGKAAFMHVADRAGRVQVYLRKDALREGLFEEIMDVLDIGDIVEVTGNPFVTKTGEKTLKAVDFRILSKCLIPLPEKWHGLKDVEIRYRQRYLDLISNPDVADIFKKRAKAISALRRFLDERGFIEVETPVLQDKSGGAEAKPFRTHFDALKKDMVLRIALELPLKKLIVGGMERVYEIGRVFRNEGISKKHSPEFTSCEFYMAYATFEDLMDLTEELLRFIVKEVTGSLKITYLGKEIDFEPPFERISVKDAIYKYGEVDRALDLDDINVLKQIANEREIDISDIKDDWGEILMSIFDELVEDKLWQPTFVTHHPLSISPLARKNDENPRIVDRFELIVAGMELANAYSELNDPLDQYERFIEQSKLRDSGDETAHEMDEDFVRALEYGMPPTAGWGMGIDRLCMLLTDSRVLRDVVLFPQLKSKSGDR